MNKFTFHTDPGHGWVEVDVDLLIDLGIHGKITSYSYCDGTRAYLEEDCDAGTFIQAYKAKHGRRPEFVDQYAEHTFIRSLRPYGMASY
jgi:hypothetical protein